METKIPKAPPPPKTFPYFVSGAVKELHQDLFQGVKQLILRKGLFFNGEKERMAPLKMVTSREELCKEIDFTLQPDGVLSPVKGQPKGHSQDQLLKIIENVMDHTGKLSHPFNVCREGAGLDPYGIVGDWLGTGICEGPLTYFLSPVCSLMELEVEKSFRSLLGWPNDDDGDNNGDGIVVPGHGLGNAYAIQIALQAKFEDIKNKGFFGCIDKPKAAMFISEDADYSIEKYCVWQGIGSSGCIRVQTDEKGRMDLADLRNKIVIAKTKDGMTPFLVVATAGIIFILNNDEAGTQNLGAIDEIDEIAKVAQEHSIWLHVDGHLAASCALSSKQKHRLKGIEKSDSVLWCPDKLLASPFVTSILVTKETNRVKTTFCFGAPYLFDQDPFYDHSKWDNGDASMACSRRADIFKIWFMWKAKGLEGLADQVDATFKNTEICISQLNSRERRKKFQLVLPDFDSNLVCFYFIPRSVKFLCLQSNADIPKFLKQNKITEKIRGILKSRGIMNISLGVRPSRPELPTFFVMNMNNTAVTPEDIQYMLDQIEYHGNNMIKIPQHQEICPNFSPSYFSMTAPADKVEPLVQEKEPKIPAPPSNYPDYVSAPIESMHKELFSDFFDLIFQTSTYYQDQRDSSSYDFQSPESLLKNFDFSLQLEKSSLEDREGKYKYKTVKELLPIIKDIAKHSIKQGHPYFQYPFTAGMDPITKMADFVTGCCTSPMLTWEDGAIYMTMEEIVIFAVGEKLGYKKDEVGGMILPGGSMSNQFAFLLAGLRKFPALQSLGFHGVAASAVIFLSIGAHYSTNKGGFFAGIGLENCVYVMTDECGKMSAKDLEAKVKKSIEDGKIPYMVVATAGTTVLGSVDPLEEIGIICRKYQLWMHVDGSYGGSLIFSQATNKRALLKGIDKADSFTINFPKTFASTRCATVFVTREKGILRQAAPSSCSVSDRLTEHFDGIDGGKDDQGVVYNACTDRRPDIFKVFLLWKAKGANGLGQHVDKGLKLANYAYKQILFRSATKVGSGTGRLEPVLPNPPEVSHVNFFYIPAQLLDCDQTTKEFKKEISRVQNLILARAMFDRKMVLAVETVDDRCPEHIVLILNDTCLTEEDVNYFLDVIEYYGNSLQQSNMLPSAVLNGKV